VTLATFYRISTSTSQAIVGGVVGIGLAVGAEVNFTKFILIAAERSKLKGKRNKFNVAYELILITL